MKRLKKWLLMGWAHVLVFCGLRVWAHYKYPRPKYQPCAFHSCRMKRQKVTEMGAFYYCPKCRRSWHLDMTTKKLVPKWVR